ncbi:MAG: hypothetical protein JNN08_08285 [Bryobacterales bacterium]|nr:hypothetical protein [Bryobacterales bacterium]
MNRLTIAAAMLSLVCAFESTAAPIAITNSSFESPILPDATFNTSVPPGWTGDFGSMYGVWNPASTWFPAGLPDGNQIGWLHAAGISQTLPDVYQAGVEYELSAFVGRWIDSPPNFTMALMAGTDTLASVGGSSSVISQYSFAPFSVTLPALAAGDPHVGMPIKIALTSTAREIDFDVIALNATPTAIPEPATWTLLLGGIGLGAVRLYRRG